jgi:hypothetical protein
LVARVDDPQLVSRAGGEDVEQVPRGLIGGVALGVHIEGDHIVIL